MNHIHCCFLAPAYNSRHVPGPTLRSIREQTRGLRTTVVVVDNNSSDGTDEYLRTHFPDVRVIRNESNVGSTAAKNQAIQAVPAEVYVTMDSDVTIQPGTIRRMLSVLQARPRAGMVSCRFVDADGKDIQDEQTCFTLRRHLAGLGVVDRLRKRRPPAGRPLRQSPD